MGKWSITTPRRGLVEGVLREPVARSMYCQAFLRSLPAKVLCRNPILRQKSLVAIHKSRGGRLIAGRALAILFRSMYRFTGAVFTYKDALP